MTMHWAPPPWPRGRFNGRGIQKLALYTDPDLWAFIQRRAFTFGLLSPRTGLPAPANTNQLGATWIVHSPEGTRHDLTYTD